MNREITKNIHWRCVNDRKKHLFENMWPLPYGVCYNSFIINDTKTALLDTVESGSDGDYVSWVESMIGEKPLDYLIINHMELDHTGEIVSIVRRWPDVKIIGNNKTFKVLEAYYDIKENLVEVKDGDTLDLGEHNLKFIFTPWVHWPETMMTYEMNSKILFTADAFGSFGTLDGGMFDDEIDFSFYEDEMRRYYSNIVGKYSGMVQKAFAKLSGVEINTLCPVHGPVWRENPAKVVSLYDKWSKYEAEDGVVVVFASMYGNTEAVADYIARQLSENGIKKIRLYDASKTHKSFLINEVWKYKGLILGSCAYNTEMHPMMQAFTSELAHMGIKNRHLGIFGSYSWSGGGVRKLLEFQECTKLELVSDPVDILGKPTDSKLKECDLMAEKMAKKILG